MMADLAEGILCCRDLPEIAIRRLVEPFLIEVVEVPPDQPIPGSWFGDPEAGLIGRQIYYSPATPVHSLAHELCHYICMSPARRERLHTDAGGGYDEENGVCYLQILLADRIDGFGRKRMAADMDAWGYTFRLGSAIRWFEEDAADALTWLQSHQLVDSAGRITNRLRWKADDEVPGESALG